MLPRHRCLRAPTPGRRSTLGAGGEVARKRRPPVPLPGRLGKQLPTMPRLREQRQLLLPATATTSAGCDGLRADDNYRCGDDNYDRRLGPTLWSTCDPVCLEGAGMLTDEQVRLYRKKRMEGKNQQVAAAAAGISERSGRNWESGPLPSQTKEPRGWRTRPDPFADVWDSEVVPLLERDRDRKLQAKVVLGHLRKGHPGCFPKKLLRTLQRRVRDWRALNGSPQEVVFPQEHPVGREAAFDFTHCDELGVTIAGQPFPHLHFVFKASASKWLYAELAFGETWEALCQGVQNALWELGGVFAVLRHDNLSAATRELKRSGGRGLTTRYAEMLQHYGARSSTIRPGKAQENGIAEKGNDLLKTALDQALRLRGHRDFESVEMYVAFVRDVVAEHNNDHNEAIEAEREVLGPLPPIRLPTYNVVEVKVRRWSTISVGRRNYSVPSRLIGHAVKVHLYADRLEVFYGETCTLTLPRIRGPQTARIDYRHVIWSLCRKPGAFARYRFREELFPTLTFRAAYDALVEWRGDRADIEYVRILHLAASTMEGSIERALRDLLSTGERFDYAAVKALAAPEPATVPEVKVGQPDLEQFDRLLGGVR
ncbi:MAG: IS21 family transposase [Myxococcota bacterium]